MTGSTIEIRPSLRWDPYLMSRGDAFHEFWLEYLQESTRNILYVLGRGFDPRMCHGLGAVMNLGGEGRRDCLLIEFDEGPDTPTTHQDYLNENLQRLAELLNGRGTLEKRPVPMWSDDTLVRRRVGS